jgi:hypothetical protein
MMIEGCEVKGGGKGRNGNVGDGGGGRLGGMESRVKATKVSAVVVESENGVAGRFGFTCKVKKKRKEKKRKENK